MLSKVWEEIAYPFPNFNGCTVEVWERISNFNPHYTGCNYLSIVHICQNPKEINDMTWPWRHIINPAEARISMVI